MSDEDCTPGREPRSVAASCLLLIQQEEIRICRNLCVTIT